MNIGDRIKQFRTNKGLSQKEIAISIGIDQAQYSRIESNKVEPTISSIEKIAEALEVDVVELFSKEKITDINSYDKNIVERLQLLDQLEDKEKKSIFTIIDMAISKKRLTDSLSNALSIAK
jgi:transcriptional regulator with XRE-family HTH domain